MLITPIINKIIPFDATKDYVLNFIANGGDQILANEIEIEDDEYAKVYSHKVNSFLLEQNIPLNTLLNGSEYRIKIRTYNSAGEFGQWSDYVAFKCYSNPTVKINNIVNGKIGNQTYTFKGSFSQSEGDALQSYRYILYNEDREVMSYFDEKFDGELTQEITQLMNGLQYYIELKTMSQSGIGSTSGLIGFVPEYIQPLFSTKLEAKNVPSKGAVEITANLVQIIGKGVDYTFENSDWLNVKNGKITFNEGFELEKDFTLKLWFKDIAENMQLMKILSPQGWLKLTFYKDTFRLNKGYIGTDIEELYKSNQIILSESDIVFLQINCVDDTYELKTEIIK